MSQYDSSIKSRKINESEKPKKSKALRIFIVITSVIIAILVIVAVVLTVLLFRGRKNALDANQNVNINIPKNIDVESSADANGSYVYYNGKKYMYNDKVTTVLFAGIDKRNYEHEEGVYGTAGQADCIFVMALNTETGKYKLMAVSRDSMVDVNILDNKGNFQGTVNEQICLSYGYGDGKEKSAENLKSSVSRLFFGIPINSYVTFDLDVISILNDQVGGVDVTVNQDLTSRDPSLYEGAQITLNGKQAEIFVRARDIYGDENQNNLRMERQKIYLTSFLKKTLKLTKEDFSTPLNMYNSCADYMITDIDASMITYYTSIFLKTGFDSDENMIKVPGETKAGEKFAEYYVDTDELFKWILDIYYLEVK